jgi:hypothetical protein
MAPTNDTDALNPFGQPEELCNAVSLCASGSMIEGIL